MLDNTWALWDSPEQYDVAVSNDGTDWGKPDATGAGSLGIMTITFPVQTARYLRITQTGTMTSITVRSMSWMFSAGTDCGF